MNLQDSFTEKVFTQDYISSYIKVDLNWII